MQRNNVDYSYWDVVDWGPTGFNFFDVVASARSAPEGSAVVIMLGTNDAKCVAV